jgi:hypothetical protein
LPVNKICNYFEQNPKSDRLLATGTGNLVGYDLLNGPNDTVGGYNIRGKISGCSNDFSGELRYTFNDITDENGFWDVLKSIVARTATLGSPRNYETHISWATKFDVSIVNSNVVGQGWPF